MPSDYIKGQWALHTSDDGAWTLETHQDDGRIESILAMRAPWPSRAAQSIATGHLCKGAQKLYEACRTYLDNRERILQAGDGNLPPDTIQQLTAMHNEFHRQVVAAVAEAEGGA